MSETDLNRRMDRMEREMAEQNHAIRQLQDFKTKMVAYGTAIGLAIGFFTGGGTFSLQHFLGH